MPVSVENEPGPPRSRAQLSGYVLEGVVARSEHSVVRRGREGSGRPVAVKQYTAGSLASMLPNLARARRLTDPNVAAVVEAGLLDGRPAVVSEWVDGASLRELLARAPGGRLPLAAALWISSRVLRALAAMHGLEGGPLAHGALGPDHVLCGRDGSVRLCGLGGPVARGRAFRADRAYVAPELRRGEPADVLSDVYAAGALVYQLLTGLTPAKASREKPLSSTQAAPLPSRLNPGLDPALDEPVLDALDIDPALRPYSAMALAERLERAVDELGFELSCSELAQRVQESFPPGTSAAIPEPPEPEDAEEPPRLAPRRPESSRRWLPIALGGGAALLVLGLVASGGPSRPRPSFDSTPPGATATLDEEKPHRASAKQVRKKPVKKKPLSRKRSRHSRR